MTFFYNLNKKLDEIRATPSTTHGQLNERDMSRAAKGYEKYGKEGMEALAKAGREGKDLDKVRDTYNKYDESVEEGLGDVVKKVGGAVKKVAGKALDTLGHGSDEDMIRDLQKKAGMPQHGKKGMAQPNEAAAPMSAKQKSFAALAEPKDKITFADKIAGAKKEVDEMLGDVAAEAMKNALGGGKKVVADEGWDDMLKDVERRRSATKKGEITHGAKHDIEDTGTGRRVTRRTDPNTGFSVGSDDDKPADGEKRGRGRPKGPAKAPERVTAKATKHKGGRKTVEEGDNESDEIKQAMAMLKKAGYEVSKAADGAEQVDEKAVSRKQQKFMGMVHATQKGEKAPSKEVAKVAKSMGKKDAEDFAATKHKGLPEKKKSEGKKEKTEEATDSTPSKGKGGIKFGSGIYDSLNRDLELMIAESMARLDESMSVNMSMNNDDSMGGASKTLTVTATDDDAVTLASLLKSAGLGGSAGCGCGGSPCNCGSDAEVVDENQPDWPTNTETSDDALQYSGGLNKPKSTGQTTVPVIASQDDRQESYAEAEEDAIKRMMEMAGVTEAKGKKPDFLDVDKDGDKEESFKKAVDDKSKEKEAVDESIFAMTRNLWNTYKG